MRYVEAVDWVLPRYVRVMSVAAPVRSMHSTTTVTRSSIMVKPAR